MLATYYIDSTHIITFRFRSTSEIAGIRKEENENTL